VSPFPSPVAADGEIFKDLAGLFIGEAILGELPEAPLNAAALNYSIDSLRAVDDYLAAVHVSGGTPEQVFRLIVRAGSYVGEVLRHNAPITLSWMRYDRAPAAIDHVTNGMGEHPAAMGVLIGESDLALLPLGKVFKFLEDGPTESTHYYAQAMTRMWMQQTPAPAG